MRLQGGLGGRGYSARKLDPTGAVDATGLGATGTSASERTVRVQLPLWNPCHASRGFRVRISVAIPGPNKIRDPPASGLPSAETERQGPAGPGCGAVGRAVSGSDISSFLSHRPSAIVHQ